MKKLLNIEYMKVKNYRTFWVILIIYAALVPLTFWGISEIPFPFLPSKSEIFGFPTVWNYITWTASWWNVLLGVLVVVMVCNDIDFKTQRQNIIDGLSRSQVIMGKFYMLIVMALAVTLYTFLIGTIMGLIFSSPSEIFSGIEYIAIYFVQTIGYFSFAFFFAVLVKKPALSIILFVVIIMLDGLLGIGIPPTALQFVPTITISDLTPFPFFQEILEMGKKADPNFKEPFILSQSLRSLLAIIYISTFVFVGYLSLKRRDL
ncbi:MAG: hypothetical protein WDZ35_01440 [Crocinitomicaceae bacterium]